MAAPKGQKPSVGAPQSPEMNKLRQSLRRKKPAYVPEASRPHQWQSDEEEVKRSRCSFSVRYLGLVEVEESRGMHVCEEAVKKLKASGRKTVKAVLWVSADGLRVVDEKTKDLIVDQTIEKVSFCAPDRNYDKAFSYICRDGTTRRWMCHCFMAIKDSGERLSHAVGCAFAACLERKQRREKECGVTASFDASRTSFVREGSFRGTSSCTSSSTCTSTSVQPAEERTPDRRRDHVALVPSLPPSPPEGAASPMERPEPGGGATAGGGAAIPRRHAPLEQLVRQGSFRGFPALSQKNSPFKRQLSLRLNDLPSTLQRKTDFQTTDTDLEGGVACEADGGVNALCSQINSSFTRDELFITPYHHPPLPAAAVNGGPPCTIPPLLPPPPAPPQVSSSWVQPDVPVSPPVVPSAPFTHGHKRTPSEAERWLQEVSNAVRPQQTPPSAGSTTIPPLPAPPSSRGVPSAQFPPLSLPCVPLIPGPLMAGPSMSPPSMVGPPMSLPSMVGPPMSLPSMVGPPMSLPSMVGPPMSLPSMCPFPLSFDAAPVYGSPPLQPALVPVPGYTPRLSSAAAFPNVVPVVGITPSQMVANVFCTATPSSSSRTGASQSCGVTTATAVLTANCGAVGLVNGANAGTTWPPEGSQLTTSSAKDDERFEAKWAALETKAGTNAASATNAAANANANAANPFSNSLQKTFEIEL
ncbi:unnamed protein product [Knipowitschia caucasica]